MQIKEIKEKDLPIIDDNFNISTCTRCNLCNTRSKVTLPVIVPNSKILIVGETPYNGYRGNSSDDLLNKILNQVGINRYECSFCHITQCNTPDNRKPLKEEVAACYDIVDYVINKVKPEVIITLGNEPMRRITKKSGVTTHNGRILEHENYPGVKIIPIVSPAFVLRDAKNEIFMVEGLKRVKSILSGEVQVRKSAVTFIDTIKKFNEMIFDLSSSKNFALDIETDSLNFRTGNIICISFSNNKGYSYVLPWNIGDTQFTEFCRTFALSTKRRDPISDLRKFCKDNNFNFPSFFWKDNPEVKDKLRGLLGNEEIGKILHNYMFDYKFLEANGLLIKGPKYDTMILHHLLDETKYTHGLDDCCLRFTDYGEYWKDLDNYIVSTEEKGSDSYGIIPIDILTPYAGTDSDVTLQIFEIFWPLLEQENLTNFYKGFLLPLSQMLMETEKNGIGIDINYAKECENKLLDLIKTNFDDKLNEMVKDIVYDDDKPEVKGINFNSHHQLRYWLFDCLRLPIISYTDTNLPSTDEGTLEQLSNISDVAKLLLDRRKKVKLLNTYFQGFQNEVQEDGKIHPNFLMTGTETGRLSAKRPPVQTMMRNPEKGSELDVLNIRVRDMLVSSDFDYYLVETDYSQAELRLIAEYSRDANLYSAFMEGRDPHAELAVRIYHKDKVPLMESRQVDARTLVTKEERQKGKTANFELVYGKSAVNFAKEEDLALEEAIHIYNVYWGTYTGISSWRRNETNKARNQGFFQSFFGRKRRIKKMYHEDEYLRAEAEREGINHLIQSQASDYTLLAAMLAIKKATEMKLNIRPVSFVHDSIVFEVKKSHIQEFLTLLKEIMLHPPGVTIPMESEAKVGDRLGSLKEWVNINGVWGEKT